MPWKENSNNGLLWSPSTERNIDKKDSLKNSLHFNKGDVCYINFST